MDKEPYMSKIKFKNNNGKFLGIETESKKDYLAFALDTAKDFLYSLNRQKDYKILKDAVYALAGLKPSDQLISHFGFYSENNTDVLEKSEYDEIVKNTEKLLSVIPKLNELFNAFKKDVDLTAISQRDIEQPGNSLYGGQPANERMYFLLFKGLPFDSSDYKRFLNVQKKLKMVVIEPEKSFKQELSNYAIFHQDGKQEGFILSHNPGQFRSSGLGDIHKARTWDNIIEVLAYIQRQSLTDYQIVEMTPVIKKVVKTSGTVKTDINAFIAQHEAEELSVPFFKSQLELYEKLLLENNIAIPKNKKVNKL